LAQTDTPGEQCHGQAHHIASQQLAAGQHHQNQPHRKHHRAKQVAQRSPFVRNHGTHMDIEEKSEGNESACQKSQDHQ
jgi:hypothetical protein